ncbi:cyclase family protein [Poseidonocella sp. HB161398]|uniref:cyclase family protein n=1 Tax=Poseidonocella sp. HB161398 TaxID=2320855 RepID=UPI001108F2BF|nr:cyclase family protein [Poseidonocella sp. HB161398]
MCPPNCLHRICEHATRRGLLKAGFTLGLGAAAGAAGSLARPAAARAATAGPVTFSEVTDMTHTLYEGFPTFSGDKWFEMEHPVTWAKDRVNLNRWTLMEHTGTHLDAPIHFSEDGLTADLIPVTDLLCPLAVIDIRQKAADDPDAYLTPEDIAAWEARNGEIPEGACVVMNSGWAAHLRAPRFAGRDGNGQNHTPGFHEDAAAMLIESRSVKGIGVDTLSLDRGLAGDFPVHYAWLGSGRWGAECLAALDTVPEAGAWLFVGGPKVEGASGGPSRIVAFH